MPRRLLASLAGLPLLALACCGEGPKHSAPGPYNYPGQFQDKAPANRQLKADELALTFVDARGEAVDLAKYRGKKNVVLVVTRGLPRFPGEMYCPSCLAQVAGLNAQKAEFDKHDAVVRVVFPGKADKVDEFIKQTRQGGEVKEEPVPFLLDKDLAVVEKLGIKGDQAKPATFIADKKGNVVYAYVGESTTDRPSVKAILEQLTSLAK